MIERLPPSPFSLNLEHKRVRLNFANLDFANALWRTIEKDKKDREEIWSNIHSENDVAEYLVDVSKENPAKEVVYLISGGNDSCIGTIHVHTISHWDHKLELGYWIAKKYEGLGFVSEAIECVEKEIKNLGFHRIEIKCNTDNHRSFELAKKNNYTLEGVGKNDCVEHGKFRDTCHFGKIL